ncbi:MAG: ABC transporter ATP-binding protein [Hydrogenophilus thermoluteolus]|nr:ABC transporter ATP-binding protein [Rhodocyclaceae bacterium]HNQ49461.1 ABC transporter ATP-binding protein [Hydrogenophilus thermoluteolus]HNU19238.1 ABC transporter ATP-binding protein [Hydrogenophilus thermoluteolus]
MSRPLLQFHHVSKTYKLYARPVDRLWERLSGRPRHHAFTALHPLDFVLQGGETVGIIGENGAGKSTLLKLAAGTIRPSTGTIIRTGHCAALLELGAGFHPEESGYRNLLLSALLQGVPPEERHAFVRDAQAFAELSDDTLARPVKTYSSGMFVRLAFAAATVRAPQLLIVDEALSVGDLHFQKKSLDRILALRDAGAAILFCSHNLYQVRTLCTRTLWLRAGRIQAEGDTEAVVTEFEAYERHKRAAANRMSEVLPTVPTQETLPPVRCTTITVETAEGTNPSVIETGETIRLRIVCTAEDDTPFHVGFALIRPDRDNVFGSSTHFDPNRTPLRGAGSHEVVVEFPALPLLSGKYLWSVYVLDETGLHVFDKAEAVCPFTVLNITTRDFGVVALPHRWRLNP